MVNLKTKPVTRERRVKTIKYSSKNHCRDAKFCVSTGVRFFLTMAFFAIGLFAFSSNAQADYYTQGILESKNMLSGADVTAINGFQVTAVVPANTTMSIKFSQDKVNYYNSAGAKEGWDSCANGLTNINLTGLGWSGGILFYKLQLTTTDAAQTPTVTDVQVDYDGTVVPPPSGNSYPTQGAIVSTNLLDGGALVFDNNVRFAYNVTSLPSSTGVSVQFSQDGASWYSSDGTLWGEDTLAAGSHLDITTSLDLSALNWSGATSFYYKLNLYSPLDDNLTPVVADAGLIKPDKVYYSVGQTTSNLMTETPTVTIASGTATFSTAQTGNIGVGDRVTYNTSDIAYISGKTSTSVWTLITKTGAVPVDITTSAVVSITREYTSLAAAEAGATDANHLNTTDLVTNNYQLNFPCYYDTGADTTAVIVSGYTTGVSNYIKIYTPNNTTTEANSSQRHQGKWDDRKYSIYRSSGILTDIRASHVIVDGVQFKGNGSGGYNHTGVYSDIISGDLSGDITVKNGIFQGLRNAIGSYRFNSAAKIYYHNNIIYNGENAYGGIYLKSEDASASFWVYNNTVYDCGVGLQQTGTARVYAKNNLIHSCAIAASGTFQAGTDYNATDAASMNYTVTGGGNMHDKLSQVIQFADLANNDSHLSPFDTAAKNSGADLSADANLAFTTDIDGQTRPASAWDIGADEAATAIYYSVGQNTNDHKTGAPTVTIASGVATFSVAQAATNMGVGDKVTYNTSSVAYISEKISTTQWKLITAIGGIPTDVGSAQTVNSITHAFDSLSAAVGGANPGASGASYLNNKNLFTGNYILNVAAYYDTGPDTTTVFINNAGENGWTTGRNNFIKIYTPFDTDSEVNLSQRHQGKWDDSKYRHEVSATSDYNRNILDRVDYLHVDGLQLKIVNNDYNYANSIYQDNSWFPNRIHDLSAELKVSNSIIWGVVTSTNGDQVSGVSAVPNGKQYYWNNIAHGFRSASTQSYALGSYDGYIYNNTIYDSMRGITAADDKTVLKNNIAQNCTDGFYSYSGVFNSASDYNISDLVADAPGANSKNSTTVQFLDATNQDFHLSPSDTVAKGAGLDLQRDTNFAFDTDIDGQVRVNPWDIGADQFSDTVVQAQQSSPNLDAGLVGHWTFDGQDVSKTTAKDVSGNNNNGTITGATVTPGKLGQGMEFDAASNQCISTTSKFTYMFTFTAWVNIDSAPPSAYSIIGPSSDSRPLFQIFSDRRLLLQSAGMTTIGFSSGTIPLNTWTHVSVAYNMISGDYTFYINGNLSGSGNSTQTLILTPSLLIGCRYNIDSFFDGKMDDVRVYDRTLSADKIGQLYRQGEVRMQTSQNDKSTDGLVGLWSFDGPDVSGATAYDSSGNGNNGTISGATVIPGKIGQGMGFDSALSQHVEIGPIFSSIFTYAAWIYLSDASSIRTIIGPSSDQDPLFVVNSSRNLELYSSGNASIGSSSGVIPLNIWTHVAVEYNRTTGEYTFFINGSSAGSGNNIQSFVLNTNMEIGIRYTNNLGFQGKIDEVRVYDRVLSVGEINELYNLGSVKIRK